MADRGDTHYHVPHLNLWFLFASLAFLGTMIWTVIDDWNSEWKVYQREFRDLDLRMTEAAVDDLGGAIGADKEELENGLEAAVGALKAKVDEHRAAERAAYEAEEARWAVEAKYKSAKSNENWAKFQTEEDILHLGTSPTEADRALAEVVEETLKAALAFEDADAAYLAAKARVDEIEREKTEAQTALTNLTRDLQRLESKREQLAPSQIAGRAANVIRDFPGLDFIGPNLKIRKYILDDLTFELNFTKKVRIDMCTTCHMGMEDEAFEGEPQPHTTHPRLDLFLSSKSPHPAKQVGCTICHRGAGEALSFQHADHRPRDMSQQRQWEEDHHWHKQHHWDYPMLRSRNIEASCVQCHTDSMELIADDAPDVTRGYRLFERYGCYSCHKVEWFPTERRPGPTLRNLASKITPEFANSWISAPKSFRPTTWMPQLFHLENLPADEVVVTSEYGAGRPILGREWNENAVAAITTFLFDRHPEQPLPPIPADVEGDPDRGREVMNLVGCYACHNTAPHPGDADAVDLPMNDVGEFNTKGPNLRGVATKINATWLYNWLEDPAAYWPETNMPDLRLSPQDAADITAYVMQDPDGIFTDTPDGWAAEGGVLDLEVLQEQARWFFLKLGRREIDRRLGKATDAEGEPVDPPADADWTDARVLAGAVGEALVRNHGCYSCHEVRGMENDMPIGTELTSWGSKTVDKLDFAMHYRKRVAGLPMLDHEYREGWIERKLLRPRSYDRDKVKTPKDKLRMPFFDFTQDQAQDLATFVLGLVDDEVQAARMEPSAEQAAMDAGLRVVRQKNCMACHVVDWGTVTYRHDDGSLLTIEGEIMPFEGEFMPPDTTSMATLLEDRAAWEEYSGEELEEIYVRMLAVHPDVGQPNDKVAIPLDKLVGVSPPRGGAFVRHVTEYYGLGTLVPNPDHDPNDPDSYPTNPWTIGFDEDAELDLIEDVDGVQRNYSQQEYDKVRWTFAPPVLVNEGHKLQSNWFYAFLQDPTTIRAQIRTRMPSFHFEPGEAEAVADYFYFKALEEWYPRYARTLRLTRGRELTDEVRRATRTGWDIPRQRNEWPVAAHITDGPGLSVEQVAAGAGLKPSQVREIEAGYAPTIRASFGKLFAWGTEQGFRMTPQLSPDGYELIRRRTPSHLAARRHMIQVGRDVGAKGPNCFTCHPLDGVYPETPIAWAPPLEQVADRLREEWVRELLWSPALIYPGTSMPDNFAGLLPQYQEFYPDSTNEQQIQAILDWLFNMDREEPSRQ